MNRETCPHSSSSTVLLLMALPPNPPRSASVLLPGFDYPSRIVTPLWLAINHQVEMFAAVGEDGESGGQPVRFSDVYFFFIVLCGIIKFRYLDSPEYTAEQSGWHKYMAPLIFGNVRY